MLKCARVCVCVRPPPRTLSRQHVSVGGRGHAELLGGAQPPAVQEDGQVDDVPHVVVAVDVGVPQDAVQVLVDGLDDDVRVAGEDGDEGALGEQDPHLGEGGGEGERMRDEGERALVTILESTAMVIRLIIRERCDCCRATPVSSIIVLKV